ncbi:MAG: HPr family phosphocarrier protein [Pseudomonadota bacterium]
MRSATVTIVNRLGLHARAASKLVHLTKTFSSEITLARDEEAVDGKSIMSVMLLAAPIGTELTLSVSGDDEDAAMAAISELIADRFGEED